MYEKKKYLNSMTILSVKSETTKLPLQPIGDECLIRKGQILGEVSL